MVERNASRRGFGFTVEVTTSTDPEYELARQLFKDATAASQDQPDLAVAKFRKAYQHAAQTNVDFGIHVFLRLPRYLQEAGRPDEAWHEFNELLASGYPNMSTGDALWHFTESAVYDKMRLFLQREKRPSAAVIFGVKSVVWDLKASLLNDYTSNKADTLRDPARLKAELSKLLRRAKLLHRLEDTMTVIIEWAKAQPKSDDHQFEKQFVHALNLSEQGSD